MVASLELIWLQGDFITLLGLFDGVGLNTNVGKTVGIFYRLHQVEGTKPEAAYGRRMKGLGTSYQERQRGQVQCTKYREEIALRFLEGHMQIQNGKESVGRRHWEATSPSGEPHTYRMAFLAAGGPRGVPGTGGDKDSDAGPFLPLVCP